MTRRGADDLAVRRLVTALIVPGLAADATPSWLSRAIHDGLGVV